MTSFKIIGGTPLKGEVSLGGAKNASFKLMIAAALGEGESQLYNVSKIGDVEHTYATLESLGVKCRRQESNTIHITGGKLATPTIPSLPGQKTRAATLFAALLLHKIGHAHIPLPGGCALGERPVDRHLDGFRSLGASVICDDTGIRMSAPGGLHSATYRFDKKSHTGTEALILAAVLVSGQTIIQNAAQEPEIDDLIEFLLKMGAKISRVGEDIVIQGVSRLHGAPHTVMPDRNEAVSFATMAYATKGDILIRGARSGDIRAFLTKLDEIGGRYEISDSAIRFFYAAPLTATDITTAPEPGFMTDWQPLWTTMMTQAQGVSHVVEAVTEHRLAFVPHLNAMGANIKYYDPAPTDPESYYEFSNPLHSRYPHAARITGPTPLHGANSTVPDLRGGATLVMAALMAQGESIIDNIDLIDRGYENFDGRLRDLSANIERI